MAELIQNLKDCQIVELSEMFNTHQFNLIIDSIYARIKFLSSRDSANFDTLKELCEIGKFFEEASQYSNN